MTRSHHAPVPPTGHRIAAIHFGSAATSSAATRRAIVPSGTDDPSTCTCDCGWSTESPTPELLDLEYRAHRRKVGAPNRVISDVIRA